MSALGVDFLEFQISGFRVRVEEFQGETACGD